MTPEPDDLGWDREKHGRMIDFAVESEDEIVTEPFEGE